MFHVNLALNLELIYELNIYIYQFLIALIFVKTKLLSSFGLHRRGSLCHVITHHIMFCPKKTVQKLNMEKNIIYFSNIFLFKNHVHILYDSCDKHP